MPPVPDDTTEIFIGWVIKIGGIFLAFISGIVATTATVTLKMKGYDDRILSLENSHKKCQAEVLKSIADKLDNIPDKLNNLQNSLQDNLDEKMEKKFCRVHDRIDTLILKEKTHDAASIKRDDLTLKNVKDVRDNQ